jgi:hypothetical protein
MPDRLAQLAAEVWDLWAHRQYAEAQPRAAEYCELAGALPGQKGQRRYAYGLNMLGALAFQLGDYPRADFLLRQSLAIFRGMSDDGHAHCAEVMQNLVRVCLHFGNRAEAESLAREALELLESLFGGTHPQVVRSRRQLAGLLRATVNLDAPAVETESLPVSPPAESVAEAEPPSFHTRRDAWYLAENGGEHEHGVLSITPCRLVWRATASDRECVFPLQQITALGLSPDETILFLDVEEDRDRHHFDIGPGAALWIYVIFDAIRSTQADTDSATGAPPRDEAVAAVH